MFYAVINSLKGDLIWFGAKEQQFLVNLIVFIKFKHGTQLFHTWCSVSQYGHRENPHTLGCQWDPTGPHTK